MYVVCSLRMYRVMDVFSFVLISRWEDAKRTYLKFNN